MNAVNTSIKQKKGAYGNATGCYESVAGPSTNSWLSIKAAQVSSNKTSNDYIVYIVVNR